MIELMRKLQEPFNNNEIEWRVGATNKEKTKGIALAYVTNRAIQNRLDETFGPFGWKNEFKEWKTNNQLCGISVWDDTKKEWITKWDGADDSATEAVKGGLSDSMKRASYQWGIGRYLYKLDSAWVDLKQQGNSYVIANNPTLPSWALPTSEKSTMLTKAQIESIKLLANRKGSNHDKILSAYKVNSFDAMTIAQYKALTSQLNSKPDKETK